MSIWRRLFGLSNENHVENIDSAVSRARQLISMRNYEDACHLLRTVEKEQHAEGMYLLAWCYWEGHGVREDALHAKWLWERSASLGYEPSIEQWNKLEADRRKLEEEINSESKKTPTEKGYK